MKGLGEYANYFSHDPLVEHVRLEIITDEAKAEELSGYIMKEGYTGDTGDGLVAILPLKKAWKIRTGELFAS